MLGLSIDTVIPTTKEGSCNYAVNGGFETPSKGGSWGFEKDIMGWKTEEIELGHGKIYNQRWNSQICELDGNKNDEILQEFNLQS